MEFIAGVESELSSRSIALTIQMAEDVDKELSSHRRWWAERRVDGVLMVDLRTERPAGRGSRPPRHARCRGRRPAQEQPAPLRLARRGLGDRGDRRPPRRRSATGGSRASPACRASSTPPPATARFRQKARDSRARRRDRSTRLQPRERRPRRRASCCPARSRRRRSSTTATCSPSPDSGWRSRWGSRSPATSRSSRGTTPFSARSSHPPLTTSGATSRRTAWLRQVASSTRSTIPGPVTSRCRAGVWLFAGTHRPAARGVDRLSEGLDN